MIANLYATQWRMHQTIHHLHAAHARTHFALRIYVDYYDSIHQSIKAEAYCTYARAPRKGVLSARIANVYTLCSGGSSEPAPFAAEAFDVHVFTACDVVVVMHMRTQAFVLLLYFFA